MLDIKKLLNEMTFEEKSAILTGGAALTSGSVARLGIPSLNMSDGPHGIRRLIGHPKQPQECHIPGGDTALPTASAVGASWSEETAYAAGQVIARDCRQEDIQMLLAPGTNHMVQPQSAMWKQERRAALIFCMFSGLFQLEFPFCQVL